MDTSLQAGSLSLTRKDRNTAALCHLLALAGYAVPLGHIVAPLILWMWKKDTSQFVADHGRESVNFQVSTALYLVFALLLSLRLAGWESIRLMPFFLCAVVFHIMAIGIATHRAEQGREFRYPLSIPFFGPAPLRHRNGGR